MEELKPLGIGVWVAKVHQERRQEQKKLRAVVSQMQGREIGQRGINSEGTSLVVAFGARRLPPLKFSRTPQQKRNLECRLRCLFEPEQSWRKGERTSSSKSPSMQSLSRPKDQQFPIRHHIQLKLSRQQSQPSDRNAFVQPNRVKWSRR
jgi:hypothetical protein